MTIRVICAAVASGFLAAPVSAAVDGAKVFEDSCIICHGERGTPPTAFARVGVQDLSSSEWHATRTDAQIRESIAKGVKDTLMPAFENGLDSDQIDALVTFVRSLAAEATTE